MSADVTDIEALVLETIASEDYAYPFKSIARLTGLDRDVVRTACHRLRDLGLAQPMKGLMDEQGGVVGSGYQTTPAGLQAHRSRLEARQ